MGLSSFFETSVEESRKLAGGDGKLLVQGAEGDSQRGIPAPSLALRYLFHSEIIAFGTILGLAGEKASMKSAFGFGLGDIAIRNGGGFHLIETEGKLNEHFMYSFLPKGTKAAQVDYVRTLEASQAKLTEIVNRYIKMPEKNAFPLVIGVDSLAGSGTEGEYEKMNKSGHAERSYPEAALLWAPFFKKLSSDILGYDILVYFTNHLKAKPAEPGAGFGKQYTKQGGSSQDFHASQYLYFNKVSNIDLVSREGKLIQLKSAKCGLGPDNRKIQIPVLWTFDRDAENDDEPVQHTWWDWDASTAKFLGGGKMPKRISSQLDVTCNSNKYSSKELGLSGMPDTEFGAAVMANEEYVEEFRKVCGYKRWTDISASSDKESG